MALAKIITAGVDVWLNTPQRPQEASGTSGMKAALNGVPSLSVLDGWWVEGCVEGVTGWAIGYDSKIVGDESAAEVASLYDKLEHQIIPMFYRAPEAYASIMRSCISLNASFFNTHRMLSQYKANAYSPRALIKKAKEIEVGMHSGGRELGEIFGLGLVPSIWIFFNESFNHLPRQFFVIRAMDQSLNARHTAR